jgi:hypothetical protein
MPNGGIVDTDAHGGRTESLDGRLTIGLKPAEPGYVQAITLSPFGDDVRVYRLRKIA